MFSNQRPRTLRTRLIAAQVALLALVCLVIGVVTIVVLRAFLMDQLDRQVRDVSHGPPTTLPIGRLAQPGQLTAWISDGEVVSAQVQSRATAITVPADLYPTLAAIPLDNTIRERRMDDLGTYRLVATPGPGNDKFITGLPTNQVGDTLWTVGLVLGGVSLVGLAAAAVAGAAIVRRTLRPLDRMAATARRVAELPLDRGEVSLSDRVPMADTDPRTEVGQVGSALNRMLGHVAEALAARHASETRVRQFVADASHELRTPLAAIRGYAELARRQDGDVPEPTAHALSRVESETARMTTLVEDLLLLARLDSGRPLLSETVDLSALVVDVVSDAQVAGQDHHWRLDLPPEPVLVTGDDARLHQVLANLLANGRNHTPPGSTVTTALARANGYVTLTVTDDGPGIPTDLGPAVFERFARGDGSRSRAAGGTGLGLAIVAAVVYAHRGYVSVESRPGLTTFTVLLPAPPASGLSTGDTPTRPA